MAPTAGDRGSCYMCGGRLAAILALVSAFWATPTGALVAARTSTSGISSAQKNEPANTLAATTSITTVKTLQQLVAEAEAMEGQLTDVSKDMISARKRVRRLKSMTAGISAILTDSAREATVTSQTAVQNRGYMKSIERRRSLMNESMTTTNSSDAKIQKIMTRLKSSTGATKSASAYEPNITAMETVFKDLSSDKAKMAVEGLKKTFGVYEGSVSAMAKKALKANFRELVDVQREALANYSLALVPPKKDPCCPPCSSQPSFL